MEMLDATVCSWDACNPHGVLLPAAHLGKIFEMVTKKLQEPSLPAAARADAAELLSVKGTGLPPLLRLLRVSGSMANGEVIHFFRFWQAFEELSRRLHTSAGSVGSASILEEPLAEEIAEFRDGLLRKLDSRSVTQAMDGFVSQEVLADDIGRMRSMSADPSSWTMLEDTLRLASLPPTEQLQLHLVFDCVLSWLRKICKEYLCESRSAKIRSVRDVAGCDWREASLHLGTANWDLESALQGFFAAQAPPGSIAPTGTSWSSRGAKISKDETECGICMNPYASHEGAAGVGAPIQMGCCFQTMCRSCHKKLVNEQHMISCPFCRVVGLVPREAPRPEQGARKRSNSLGRICKTAERIASGACRAFDGVREVSRSHRMRRDAGGQDAFRSRHDEYYRTLPRVPVLPSMVLA